LDRNVSDDEYSRDNDITMEVEALAKRAKEKQDTVRQLPSLTENGKVPAFVNVFCFGCQKLQHTVITDGKVHERSLAGYNRLRRHIQDKFNVRLVGQPLRSLESGAELTHPQQ